MLYRLENLFIHPKSLNTCNFILNTCNFGIAFRFCVASHQTVAERSAEIRNSVADAGGAVMTKSVDPISC